MGSNTSSNKGDPLKTYTEPPNDRPMVTIGMGLALTLLVVAVMMFAGATLSALGVVNAAIYVFVVAFASAPLFARLRMTWSVRAAVLGSILGWGLSAPLEALITMATNTADSGGDAFEILAPTWLYALVPLISALVVGAIRQVIMRRARY